MARAAMKLEAFLTALLFKAVEVGLKEPRFEAADRLVLVASCAVAQLECQSGSAAGAGGGLV